MASSLGGSTFFGSGSLGGAGVAGAPEEPADSVFTTSPDSVFTTNGGPDSSALAIPLTCGMALARFSSSAAFFSASAASRRSRRTRSRTISVMRASLASLCLRGSTIFGKIERFMPPRTLPRTLQSVSHSGAPRERELRVKGDKFAP